jgi:general secretion pathway protein A
MYERHFGFAVKPFALTPDPAFLYPSRQHAMAMTMLEYFVESQATFSVLTGEIGSGKTTLLRHLLRNMGTHVNVGLISNTHQSFKSIHPWALSALSVVPSDDSNIALYEALNDSFVHTYSKGGRTLLILDEAQNLCIEALEELRLLSNVNSEKDLVLQILLIGQPELRSKLADPQLVQFAQRVSADFHIGPLNRDETAAYIAHRLKVAGGNTAIFRAESIDFIYARTNGVPRLVNQICDMALLYAFAEKRHFVDVGLVAQVVNDRGGTVVPAYSHSGAAAAFSHRPRLQVQDP